MLHIKKGQPKVGRMVMYVTSSVPSFVEFEGDKVTYRTCAIITPSILGSRIEEFPCLVHKLFVIHTNHSTI